MELPWVAPAELAVLARLALALALGAAVGLEREKSGKPAGLRTNMLICAGAELFTEASLFVSDQLVTHDLVRTDPGRIAAQIVSGIGFIGAGTILVMRGTIRGLTTAATLWVVAAIGMTVGLRLYTAAIGAVVLVLLTLAALGKLERVFFKERARGKLRIELEGERVTWSRVEEILTRSELEPRRGGFTRADGRVAYTFYISGSPAEQDAVVRELGGLEDVRSVRIDR